MRDNALCETTIGLMQDRVRGRRLSRLDRRLPADVEAHYYAQQPTGQHTGHTSPDVHKTRNVQLASG